MSSRPIADVEEEFQFLLEHGFREINIIGQDITAYGKDSGATLEELLRTLLRKEGDYYMRLMYLHPVGLRKELMALIEGEKRIIPYLDIPIQHSEDRILSAMGRKHSKADLEKLLGTIRNAMPDMTLRTSLITGFPVRQKKNSRPSVRSYRNGNLICSVFSCIPGKKEHRLIA